MAIRFPETDSRPMGRNTSGVKGITLQPGDRLVAMVVADPEATLLTACENGYGKRTYFGVGDTTEEEGEEETSSSNRYRTQHRGGKGLRDIKTTARNGKVIGAVRVQDDDELLMMTARGKIQRIKASDVNVIGRNTQGVRIMSLDEGDALAAIVRVPKEENGEELESAPPAAPTAPRPPAPPASVAFDEDADDDNAGEEEQTGDELDEDRREDEAE
jgi:DNA gyrase subunit A